MRPLLLTLLVLVAVSVSMSVVWVVSYVMAARAATLTVVSAPAGAATPTPSPPVHESDWFLIGAGLSWLATFGAAVGLGVWWVVRRLKTRPEERA